MLPFLSRKPYHIRQFLELSLLIPVYLPGMFPLVASLTSTGPHFPLWNPLPLFYNVMQPGVTGSMLQSHSPVLLTLKGGDYNYSRPTQ